LSVQLPFTVVPAVSGPAYVVFGVHEATPDVASAPFQVTSGFAFTQPFAFGAGFGEGVTTGGAESYFSPKLAVALLPAASVHEP
jgi:hypothetical protein